MQKNLKPLLHYTNSDINFGNYVIWNQFQFIKEITFYFPNGKEYQKFKDLLEEFNVSFEFLELAKGKKDQQYFLITFEKFSCLDFLKTLVIFLHYKKTCQLKGNIYSISIHRKIESPDSNISLEQTNFNHLPTKIKVYNTTGLRFNFEAKDPIKHVTFSSNVKSISLSFKIANNLKVLENAATFQEFCLEILKIGIPVVAKIDKKCFYLPLLQELEFIVKNSTQL